MTVYIELVLIDNFVIDYLLLKATFVLMGVKTTRKRLFLCAFLGSVIALAFPLIKIKTLSTAVKILTGFLLTILSADYRDKREYFISTAIFFLLTFLTGGAIIGVYSILGLDYSAEFSIAVMILPVYVIIKVISEVIKFIYRRKNTLSWTYKIELGFGENSLLGVGFLDTGNALYDGDNPVIITTKRFALKLIDQNFYKLKFKKIMVRTVLGESQKNAVIIERLVIYNEGKRNIFNNVTVCISDNEIGDGYDVILHPAFMEERYDEKRDIKTEKVS